MPELLQAWPITSLLKSPLHLHAAALQSALSCDVNSPFHPSLSSPESGVSRFQFKDDVQGGQVVLPTTQLASVVL